MNKEKICYLITDYDNNYNYSLMVFDHYLTLEERKKIQNTIYKLKEEIEEWQVEDIIENLHNYFDFKEQEISEKTFLYSFDWSRGNRIVGKIQI